MAHVINRSEVPVEVYGVKPATGESMRWLLLPGSETDAAFECRQVRAADGGEIFGGDDWWEVRTEHAFIYTRDDGFFTDDLSLHCVPFVFEAGSAPPYRPGYSKAGPDPVRDSLFRSDPIQRPFTPVPGQVGGELGTVPDADFGYGRLVRSQFGNDIYLSARLRAVPDSDLNSLDLGRLPDKKAKWKKLIELVWFDPPAADHGERLHIELDWIEADGPEHYAVDVITPDASRSRLFGRANYDVWPIDLDDADASPADFPICAHEFGHILGLNDGYVIEAELPFLADDADVQKTILGEEYEFDLPSWPYWWTPVTASWLGRPRARRRIEGKQCPAQGGDIMDDEFGQDQKANNVPPASRRPIISVELVNALVERRPQRGLCYARRQFAFKTKPWIKKKT